jgi:hypothetical protein
MLKRWKYQIYGVLGFAIVCAVSMGNVSTDRNSESWINTMFFHFFGLELSKKPKGV